MSTSDRRRTRSGPRRRRRPGPKHPSTPADPELDATVDPESAARTILLNKLTGQPRTRAELAGTLAERGIPDEVADRVLERFGDVGLIDDAAFAAAWVESRHTGRGLARRALAHELRHRGVEDDLVREAVEELDPVREAATARELVRRKLRTMRRLDGPAGRQSAMRRLLGMLARKGYPAGLAMTIVREELAATDDELPMVDESGLEPDDEPGGPTIEV
jgi:regulatory protein